MPSLDLTAQNLSPFQTNQQLPGVVTIASAATIAPTTFLTVVTGVVAIANITPPATGMHMLCLVPTGALPAFLLTGNITNAGAISTANVPFFAIFNPVTGKYNIAGKA